MHEELDPRKARAYLRDYCRYVLPHAVFVLAAFMIGWVLAGLANRGGF